MKKLIFPANLSVTSLVTAALIWLHFAHPLNETKVADDILILTF